MNTAARDRRPYSVSALPTVMTFSAGQDLSNGWDAGAGGFDQIVFAGDGTSCFWQGGFLDEVRRPVSLKPARISSVSGGALAAACFIA